MKKIKYLLLIMLITFMSLAPVNADVEIDPCYNDYLIDLKWNDYYTKYDSSKDSWVISSYSNSSMIDGLQHLFPTEAGKTYYIKTFTGRTYSKTSETLGASILYDENKNIIDTNYDYFTITINNDQLIYKGYSNISFISINPLRELKSFLGTTVAFADFDLSTCPVVEEPEPEPEPIIPDTTLDNFYSIYVTKLKELSQYAFENKYILGTLAIILLFIILEIILNLFGRRKL